MGDNTLQKYVGQSYDIIDKVAIKNGVSKDGATYIYLDLHFVNGFNKRLYAQGGDSFAIASAIEYLQGSKQLDVDF